MQKNDKEAIKLEQQIQRIHDLLERGNGIVTWNDKIPDPDNPDQLRQIDITIQNNNKITFIECRAHKKPQDVMWIEELIGRRKSLNADMIIGVSSSGFTKGAIAKAEKHGIVLRKLSTLTQKEIASWGKTSGLRIDFYEYRDVCIRFYFNRNNNMQITTKDIYDYILQNPFMLSDIYNCVSEAIEEKNIIQQQAIKLKLDIKVDNLIINNQQVIKIGFESRFSIIQRCVEIPYILTYNNVDSHEKHTFVEKFEYGDSEVIFNDKDATFTIDTYGTDTPPYCQLRNFNFSFPVGTKIIMSKVNILMDKSKMFNFQEMALIPEYLNT